MAAGHAHSEIENLTLHQFETYLDLARKREKESMRWLLVATALGNSGGPGLQKALKALE